MNREEQLGLVKLLYGEVIDNGLNYVAYKQDTKIGFCNLETGFDTGAIGLQNLANKDFGILYTYSYKDKSPGLYFDESDIYIPRVDKVYSLPKHSVIYTFNNCNSNLLLASNQNTRYSSNGNKPYVLIIDLITGDKILEGNYYVRADNTGALFDGIISLSDKPFNSNNIDPLIVLANGEILSLDDYINHLKSIQDIKITKRIKNYTIKFPNNGTLVLTKYGLLEWVNNWDWAD